MPPITAFAFSPTLRDLITLIAASSLLYTLFSLFRVGRRSHGLPPGPPTVPLLGNDHQIPKADAHFLMTEWSQKYGGIFSLKRFMNTTLVINDWKYIKNLLDKKSTIYSYRPQSLVADLITHGDHVLMMQYGETWRAMRKLIHQTFMEPMCEKEHFKVQEAEANQMIHDFLTRPKDHMLHPKRFSNSITMALVFGIRTKTIDDNYMKRLYHLMEKWSLVLETGATPPVDSFPLLKFIPQRLMGNWRSRAVEVHGLMASLYTEVLHRVYDRRKAGVMKNSLMDRVLDQQERNQFNEHQLAFLGGTLMEGGSDTSSSLILAIIQATTQYPEVQSRAQEEIDAVIGDDRSPRWSDFSKLPYINMIIKEAHRWRPVLPLGVVHGLSEDDHVDGMHLPKDSTIILNVWALHNDKNRWKNPEHFIPERYENYPALAPLYAASKDFDKRDHLGYGASRRICPGIHLAERNLFIATAKLLWAFKFHHDPGMINDVSAETGSSQGFMHCVKDYGCRIELRSDAKRATIEREMAEAQEVFDRFD